jgi:hypothetical protein
MSHPDQPYTPSTDDELRQWTADEQVTVDSICAVLSTVTWRDSEDIRAFDIADALLPLIASVRRDAQADAWDECVRRVADMPISGTGYARIIRWAMPTNPYRAAAIRRGEGEEN